MEYAAIKNAHMGMAYLSVLLFVIRFALGKLNPATTSNKLLNILPHAINVTLLFFAAWLCIIITQYPLTDHWLSAKVMALFVYIGFGIIAIKLNKNWAFVATLLSFVYILGAAKSHSVLWFLG